MALPLAPIAYTALRYGAVAVATYALSRRVSLSQTRQENEDALDRIDEGLAAHRPKDRNQINGSARYRRTIWFGNTGVEFDATALGRIKIRKLK